MVTGYFGVPGCGKTTFLTALAQKELRRIRNGKSAYHHVLTNFYCEGCERISVKDLGHYDMEYCLILLDELTLDCDARDYKKFSDALKQFFILHRHLHCDVIYFVQDFSQVDKIIRNVTFDLWYTSKPILPFFRNFSVARRVYRQIAINENTSELVLGYRFSKFLERIFDKSLRLCWRPRWYKYFDSYDKGVFVLLPSYQFIKWSDDSAAA